MSRVFKPTEDPLATKSDWIKEERADVGPGAQRVGVPLDSAPQMLVAHDKPIRVRFASGHAVEFPAGTTPEDAQRRSQAVGRLLQATQADPSGLHTTLGQNLRQGREAVGRVVASMLGIDYDEMKKLEDQGIRLGMMPMPLSGISKDMVAKGIGETVTADAVKPRRGMFHSFIVDKGGNIIDLGDLTHDVAIARANVPINVARATDEEIAAFAKAQGFDIENIPIDQVRKAMGKFGEHEAVDLPAELERHGLVRLQVQPSSIAVEIHHRPTPHQIDALAELVEKNPKAKASYDLFHGDMNEFKNGVAGEDFLKRLNDFYYSGKTNTQMLRDSLDKKLGGLTNLMKGEGEFLP